MNKVLANRLLWASGLCAVLLLFVVLGQVFGDKSQDAAQQALRQGNALFEQAEYAEALDRYQNGLAAAPRNQALAFNAAQAAYQLGEYESAVALYAGSADSADKFLNLGNALFGMGQSAAALEEQMEYYTEAVQSYERGIRAYPQNVELKYNYEAVGQIMAMLMQAQADVDSQNPPAAGEGSNEVQAQGKEGREQTGTSEEQNPEALGGDPDNAGEDENKRTGESEKTNEEDGGGQDEGDNSGNEDETGQGQNDQEADLENLFRIMRIVEGQEEASLKNNQGVMEDKDVDYGSW